MTEATPHHRSSIIPCLQYRDARAAIDHLCRAFGFEEHLVVPNEDDPTIIEHAQIRRGDAMVMLGSVRTNDFSEAAREAGAAPTLGGNTLYIVVDDVDAHAERARAAGATIFMEPEDQAYGGRNYSARDPEGNIWSFGSYDPWADPGPEPTA